MMMLEGKGFYIWRIENCEGGDTGAIASLAGKAKFTHVLVKIADGTYSYNYDWDRKIDLVPPLVEALRRKGIKVWGWQYVYGNSPVGEARKAIERVTSLGVDGFVIDAEASYKEPGKKSAARRYMDELRSALPNTPIALSSYRYPSYHPQLPWREFLEKCDINMPQVYWQASHNPGAQLNRCVREFQAITPLRPIIPTGAAYSVGSWKPTTNDILEFLRTAQELNLSAANFWEWSRARTNDFKPIWKTIKEYPWSGGADPGDIVDRYFAALNAHDIERVLQHYLSNAAHVTVNQTDSGHDAIRRWYRRFLFQSFPDAVFTLTGYTGSGNNRHITWTAKSSNGSIQSGNDIMGLLNGRIIYHYTFFGITP